MLHQSPPHFSSPTPVVAMWSDCSTAVQSLVRMEGTVLTVVWGSPAPVLLASPDPTVRARWSETRAPSPRVVGMEPVCEPGVAGWPGVSVLTDMSVQRVENSATTAESLACRVTMAAVEIKAHLHPVHVIRGTRVDAAD